MDRKGIWIIAAAMVLGAVLLGISQAVAQRDFRTDARGADNLVPRYQVVNVTSEEIIVIDTFTGDLYSAKPKDVKPYSARPRSSGSFRTDGDVYKDKDKPFTDKKFRFFDKDKVKVFDKDKDKVFDKDKDKPPLPKDKPVTDKPFFDKDKPGLRTDKAPSKTRSSDCDPAAATPVGFGRQVNKSVDGQVVKARS